MAAYALSSQQQAVLDFALKGTGNLNLVARAGCGKTSTLLSLVEALIKALPRVSIFIGAYNRAIANEIVSKLAALGVEDWKKDGNGCWVIPKAQANTMHGAGFAAWKKVAPETKKPGAVDEKKLTKIVAEYLKTREAELALNPALAALIEVRSRVAIKAVSLAKQRAFGVLVPIQDRKAWLDLIDHFGLEQDLTGGEPDAEANPEELEAVVKFAQWLYKRSLEACYTTIDFDDMILAPLYYRVKMFTYDWVLIDEAQDTNPARRELAKRMVRPGSGRFIAVGDPAQAIYGFTGADSDSMEIIKKELNCQELPLNVTYRCPKAIVKVAQQWVPDITAAPSAPEGLVRNLKLYNDSDTKAVPTFWEENLTAEDVILCRNTKPLVEIAYALLRRGTACQIEGRKIAEGLVKLINKWKVVNLPALDKAVSAYREKEVARLMAKEKEQKADQVADQCETVLTLSAKLQEEGKRTVAELVTFINSIFGSFDDDTKVMPKVLTLATIHRSKGREWNRVYLLGRKAFQPSKYAKKDWQIEQEVNLCYVAVTRAKAELVEVEVPPPAKKRAA